MLHRRRAKESHTRAACLAKLHYETAEDADEAGFIYQQAGTVPRSIGRYHHAQLRFTSTGTMAERRCGGLPPMSQPSVIMVLSAQP